MSIRSAATAAYLLLCWLVGGCHLIFGYSEGSSVTADLVLRDDVRWLDGRPRDAPSVDRKRDLASADRVKDLPGAMVEPQAACGRPTALQDSFDDTVRASFWAALGVTTSGGTAEEKGGRLILVPPLTASKIGYRSLYAVNLREDYIRAELPVMLEATSSAMAFLTAERDAANQLSIVQQQGTLVFYALINGTTSSQTLS